MKIQELFESLADLMFKLGKGPEADLPPVPEGPDKEYPRVGNAKPKNRWDRTPYDRTNGYYGIDTSDKDDTEHEGDPGRNIRDMSKDPKFMSWFGKSKCVDRYGKPIVMFHGTMAHRGNNTPAIDRFAKGGKGVVSHEDGSRQDAFFFTPISQYADSYGNTVYPVYLKILNPAVMNTYEQIRAMTPDHVRLLKSMGFDGAVERDGTEWCVFDSSQIKSATGNNGNYSSDSDHIGESK